MGNYKFETWCMKAIAQIRFPPDQDAVLKELYDHMEDHCDALMAQGLSREEAETQTLEAMGSAEEIAPQLAAIHRPFWGWCLWISRIALVLLLCAAVFAGVPYFRNLSYSGPNDMRLYVYEEIYMADEMASATRVFCVEPDQSVKSDGYTLTLTRASKWTTDYLDKEMDDFDSLYFQIEVFNPRPWAGEPEFFRWLWAEDSLGNHYYSPAETVHYSSKYNLSGSIHHTAPLTYTLDMWICDFRGQDSDWIDLHYDRSGRDIVFRIDLTGGDQT